MSKLMIAVAAAAVAGGAFAHNVFDYKASVKYVDFKKVTVKADVTGEKVSAYFKVVKSASLTGYLVTPYDCPCAVPPTMNGGPCERFGNVPSFLVLQNKAANKFNTKWGLSKVKLMPANLLTEWWTSKTSIGYDKNWAEKNISLQAQGYLFAGVGKRDVPDPVASPFYGLGDFGEYQADNKLITRTAATQFLFGEMNIVAGKEYFIEPFLDHAGFGKAKYTYDSGVIQAPGNHPCAAPGKDGEWWNNSICLVSLSGHVIGGAYSCMLNAGIWGGSSVYANAEDWICQGWDDYTENAFSVNGVNNLQQNFDNKYEYNVVCGTWSIKVNTKLGDNDCDYIDDVVQCGRKIDKAFDLCDFDDAKNAVEDPVTGEYATLKGMEGEFVKKWIGDKQ